MTSYDIMAFDQLKVNLRYQKYHESCSPYAGSISLLELWRYVLRITAVGKKGIR